MGRLSIFDHPLLLGFEEIERTVGGLTKSAGDGYPPYNIEQTRPGALRITLAVAGFAEEQLSITIESRQLVVRCKQGAGGRERVFLRRGIAARQFQRSFVLANGIEVGGASLEPPPIAHRHGMPSGRSIGSLGRDHNRTGQNARRSHRGRLTSLEMCGTR